MKHAWVLIMTLTLAWALTGCPPAPPPSPSGFGDSVRMGTFNVQFLPGSDDDETRSVRIADRILAGQYDIIALNEVFDEEAREKFISKLKETYPSYVAYIGDAAVGAEDSGLMLFSRFPFEPLPNPQHKHDPDYLEASNAGADWKDVAFIEYDEDVFPDNWAGKGAAFVRIKNPTTGRILNVAFTHMQASYPEDEDDAADWLEPIHARTAQLADLRKVIEGSLVSGQLTRESVFVLGDLNIDGDLADPNLGLAGYDQPNLFEWEMHFNTPGNFFTSIMKDAWAFEHSPKDRGLTNMYHWGPEFAPDQGARLDYVLRNRPSGTNRLAIQHLTLAHNMRDGAPFIESGLGMAGINELSDHIGINADINRWAPACNPTEAVVPVDGILFNGTITYPGSMQWLRVDEPGTYAMVLYGDGMDFRVYDPRDLSTPVPQYYDETVTFTDARGKPHTGKKFHLPETPFYIRIFHTDRSKTGTYQFIVHRNRCNSMEEACVLRANEPVAHTLPNVPINADDVAWFELRTEAADSGEAQSLRFVVDQFSQDVFAFELVKEDGTTVVDTDATAESDPDNPGGLRLLIEHRDKGPGKFYLRVKRYNQAVTSYQIQ
jgi:endonuclease/exonuclease/phosphatase family metal-dependent hydrolase